MASFGLRRLYVSSQNCLRPATRFSANGTRHVASQWRVPASHAKFSTMDEYEDTTPPVASSQVKLDLPPLPDAPDSDGRRGQPTDWSKSFSGLSSQPFAKEIADVLLAPLDIMDVEIKPGKRFQNVILKFVISLWNLDGLCYLPEIKYRRILNTAFGPGGWGLAARSETNVGPKTVSREYALVCLGRSAVFFIM